MAVSCPAVSELDDVVTQLRARLRRYPHDRYPVQHATAQFHLGCALLNAGEAEEAVVALRAAAGGFAPDRLPVEHAKARNMLGAALRDRGDITGASDAFASAAATFAEHGLNREEAAAQFNLGLVRRQAAADDAAVRCFQRALGLFDELRLVAQVSAAARELGTTLLGRGDVGAAARILGTAVDAASRAGDHAALGAAANTLGLAELAADRAAEAVAAFAAAAVAHSRGVRPDGHAMAQANLALGLERLGDIPRARLAARQALGVRGAPRPVTIQAEAVLERLGSAADDLHAVLDTEPAERWAPVLRAEVARWADAPAEQRRSEAGAWVDGQLARPDRAVALAEAWLGAVLELPPPTLDALLRSILEALAERDARARERFRREVTRALATFGVPQWLRTKDTLNRLAAELGQEPGWG
jgi:tetratricopeptide (TPR) repeat protein